MKILITSLSAGSGHVRAAEALLAAIKETHSTAEVVHVDVANFVTPNFRRLYVEGYRLAVMRAPNMWGHLYRFSDHSPLENVFTPLLHHIQRSCASGFYAYVERFRPDLILTTHFLIPQLLSAERHHPSFGPPVETVITDYDVHRFWVSNVVTRYYVAHEGMAKTLSRYGIPASRVMTTGIPVLPSFLRETSVFHTRRKLNLDDQRPVFLMLSGGLGINELEGAVKRLMVQPGRKQIITVSGNNALLRSRLERLIVPSDTSLVNLGYVNNMHELLDVSHFVITKPGGLTVAECLAKKKVMVLFSPIPGQEEKNAEFLVAQGAAALVRSIRDLPAACARLISNQNLVSQILSNVESTARPQAAYLIAQNIIHASSLAA